MAAANVASDSHLLDTTEANIERRKKFVDLQPEDIPRIVALQKVVADHADELVEGFFAYLSKIEEAGGLFRSPGLLEQVKRLKREHLIAMVQGDYGRAYVQERVKLGLLYGRVQLEHPVFLGAFHHLMRMIGKLIVKHFKSAPNGMFEHYMSFNKIAFFDLGIFVDVLVDERERTILQQRESIRELSTPVLQLRERLLILPIIGLIDTHRAKQLTDGLLQAIRANRAKVVVLDITGVGTVDSKVANHLIQTVSAARLMGATAIITGLSAEIAQTLVTLGVDLGRLATVGDLQGGIEEAERLLGYRLVAVKEPPSRLSAE